MDFEKYPTYSNQHGIHFSLILIVCSPAERNDLWFQRYDNDHRANSATRELVERIFDHMQVRDRPYEMKVVISEPLTRRQADTLNSQRDTISNIAATVGGAIGGLPGKAFKGLASLAIVSIGSSSSGYIARNVVLDNLPTYHVGDRIISVDASVNGGIGPQRSTQSILLKTAER